MSNQMECRVVLTTNRDGKTFGLGMYDPISGRYEALGTHPNCDKDKIVRDISISIQRAGHRLTYCERSA